ncbi:hypothetical protein BIW11_00581 [Tropilaelaps mercedesae]|uniref:Uncharacterized protein n=1 Tax=Tropilaelaps mercedesae TaxID=418985 RepID=A0A1V9XT25_9ACAR|nr:hypothetical protein BIW11_00581 [Tropilaelaps mercedesae]
MDAETLATTLVSGGQSEAEKLCLIRRAFQSAGNQLKPADVAFVQERLGADRRLVRLAIAFADAARNKEFAMAELLSENIHTPGIIATRFQWLHTTEILLNEAFLLNELTKMSYSARLKILNGIGRRVEDVELGDRLWKAIRTHYPVRYANRLLAACSNQVIIHEITNNRAVRLTDAQMLHILQKRFESGVELLCKLLRLHKDGALWQGANFTNSLDWLLLRDFERGFSILVDFEVSVRFGANRTRSLLKALAVCGDSKTVAERIVRYVRNLDQRTLRRYASKELYLECFLEKESNFSPACCSQTNSVMEWLNGFDRSEQRRFLEALYQRKHHKSIMESPMEVFPEMWYVLDEAERVQIVRQRLEGKDYSLARHQYAVRAEYFWRSMLPCRQSFPDLKSLLASEHTTSGRCGIYILMITSPIAHRNAEALVQQLKFVVDRSRNENHTTQCAIMSSICTYYKLKHGFAAEIWGSVKKFYENLLLSCSPRDLFSALFLVLRSIEPTDTVKVKEFAGLLSKAHLSQKSDRPYDLSVEFNSVRNHDSSLILGIMLKEQDAEFAKNHSTNYDDLPNCWRVLGTVAKLGLDIDLSPYPNIIAFLKYVVSPEKKTHYYLNDLSTVNRAYELVKVHLTDQDRSIGTTDNVKFESLARAIRKTKNVTNLDLDVILHDTYASKVAFMRKVARLLAASNAISPDMLRQALHLSSKDNRRVAATRFLAMCMPVDDFMSHFRKFIPKHARINAGEIDADFYDGQKALIAATKSLCDSSAAMEILVGFMQGDYLKMAVGTFNYYCARSPPNLLLPVLTNNLSGGKVSMQKHFIRWFFVYAADNVAKLREVIAMANNGSTKLELLKVIYRMAEDKGEDAWPILKACLDTVRGNERQVMHFVLTDCSIDSNLGEQLPAFYRHVYELALGLPESEKHEFDYFYSRAATHVAKLPEDLRRAMCLKALEQDLSAANSTMHVKLFVARLAMHDSPVNLEFVLVELEKALTTKATFARTNVRAIVEAICTVVVAERPINREDHFEVFPRLLNLLTSHVEYFFVEQVQVELTQLLMEIPLPADFNFKDVVNAAFVREYTLKALELLDKRLDQVGAQMFATLSPLLVKTIEPFVCELTTFRARMLETYRKDMPASSVWFLLDCLPNRDNKRYDEDKDVYEGFIKSIQEGSDVVVKVMLNVKLRSLNYENV